jgi:hypothetical protein
MNGSAGSLLLRPGISPKSGAYFATSFKLRGGVRLELGVKIPEEIEFLPLLECKFIGRVAQLEPFANNGMPGVGVHFLCYSLDGSPASLSGRAALFSLSTLLLPSRCPPCRRVSAV